MYSFRVKKFSNGLRVLMVPSKESLSFEFSALVNTGSDFENKKNNGISHFLEHLCFKGTEKRKNNFEIAKELDSIGASYNAFTSNEITGYYVKVAAPHFEKAIDMVSDIYLNSRFPLEEVEKERGVIQEEIKMYHDDPKSHIYDLWAKLLFGDQPAGWPVSGSINNVKKIKREEIIAYRDKQYRSKSTLIIISGNFNQKKIIDLVQQYFASIKKGRGDKKQAIKKITTPEVLLEYRPLKQTNFILGVYGLNVFDKRKYALEVLDAIFNGGMSGRLYQLVREKLGAAYLVTSFDNYFTDRGEYGVIAGIDSDRIFVVKEILKELMRFTTEKVSNQELKKAKDFITGRLSLSLENVHHVAFNYGSQLILENKIETPKEYLRKIKSVSASDILKVSRELFKPNAFKLAIIGPYKNKEAFYRLLKI